MKKRILSLLLCLALVFGTLQGMGTVRAAEAPEGEVYLTADRSGDVLTVHMIAKTDVNFGGLSLGYPETEGTGLTIVPDGTTSEYLGVLMGQTLIAIDTNNNVTIPAGEKVFSMQFTLDSGLQQDKAYTVAIPVQEAYNFPLDDYAWAGTTLTVTYRETYTWTKTADGYSVTAAAVSEGPDAVTAAEETVTASYQVITEPGCETTGLGRYTAAFENELFTVQTKDETIAALGHAWGAPVWEWHGNDTEGYPSATVHYTCTRCGETDEWEEATELEQVAPTCEEAGSRTYSVWTVGPDGLPTPVVTKTVTDPALGHLWQDPTFVWNTEGDAVTAHGLFVCARDERHTATKEAEVTAAEPDKYGVTTYTAAVTAMTGTQVFTETKDVAGPAPGDIALRAVRHGDEMHLQVWVPEGEVNLGGLAAMFAAQDADVFTLDRIETRMDDTLNADDGFVILDTADEIDFAAGENIFDLVFAIDTEKFTAGTAYAFTVSADEAYNSIGSDFVWAGTELSASYTETYTWAEDLSSVTAKAETSGTWTAGGEKAETVEETVNTTSEETLAPTCTEEGAMTYTAVFTKDAFTAQTKETAVAALGHAWGEPAWTWTGNDEEGWNASALFTCTRCGETLTLAAESVTTEEDPVTYDVTYTASVTGPDGETYTASRVSEFPGVYIKVTDYTKGAAALTGIETGRRYKGTVTFTASCNAACVLALVERDASGEVASVTKLYSKKGASVPKFTLQTGKTDMEIVVIIKGDALLDGRFSAKDVTFAKQVAVGNRPNVKPLQILAVDENGDGKVQAKETTLAAQVAVGNKTYAWDAK